jgi:Xaa-Pro aminopeptidase
MMGSSTAASREGDRRKAPMQLESGRGEKAVPRDRRTLGQTNTLLERGVDLERLRGDRLRKVQAEMRARDVGALLLTDPINIRYVTGVSVMPLWSATNLAHYVLVPAEGNPVVFEYARAKFRPEEFFSDVRNARYWQARFAEGMAAERSVEWGAEIEDTITGWGVADARLGVDSLDYHGFSALQGLGIRLTDADDPVEAARVIKTADEIELLKQSAAVCEAALFDLAEAIRPGVSEHELLGVFYTRCSRSEANTVSRGCSARGTRRTPGSTRRAANSCAPATW